MMKVAFGVAVFGAVAGFCGLIAGAIGGFQHPLLLTINGGGLIINTLLAINFYQEM